MELNLEIKESGISGKGVYATEPIKKGETIYVLDGEIMDLKEMKRRVDNEEEEGSDPLGVDDELYRDLNELSRTFNHSCNPNAFIRGRSELTALRDIEKGEEITYDYSTTMNDNIEREEQWRIKCECGAKNCRGVIDQFATLLKCRQDFYLKNKFAPDFILRKFSNK